MRAISLCYHDVVDPLAPPDWARGDSHYTLSRGAFRTHLQWLTEEASTHLTTVDDPSCWRRDPPLFLTFDDGARCAHASIADELELRGWRGHFFIVTSWIGRRGFLSPSQITDLRRRGHVIGTHSVSHPDPMRNLSWPDLLREWSDSRSLLEDLLGMEVRVGSLPGGAYSRRVAEAAAESGLNILFTSAPRMTLGSAGKCLLLGRYTLRSYTRPGRVAAVVAGSALEWGRAACAWYATGLAQAALGPLFPMLRNAALGVLQHGSGARQ